MIKVEGIKSVCLQAGKLLRFEMYEDAPSESFEAAEAIMNEINTESGILAVEDMEIRVVAMNTPSKKEEQMKATVTPVTRYDITVNGKTYPGMFKVSSWEGLVKYSNEQTFIIATDGETPEFLKIFASCFGKDPESFEAQVIRASPDV